MNKRGYSEHGEIVLLISILHPHYWFPKLNFIWQSSKITGTDGIIDKLNVT
jgi:hypothetical protein